MSAGFGFCRICGLSNDFSRYDSSSLEEQTSWQLNLGFFATFLVAFLFDWEQQPGASFYIAHISVIQFARILSNKLVKCHCSLQNGFRLWICFSIVSICSLVTKNTFILVSFFNFFKKLNHIFNITTSSNKTVKCTFQSTSDAVRCPFTMT